MEKEQKIFYFFYCISTISYSFNESSLGDGHKM